MKKRTHKKYLLLFSIQYVLVKFYDRILFLTKKCASSACYRALHTLYTLSTHTLRYERGLIAQLARALVWHTRGQGFESP